MQITINQDELYSIIKKAVKDVIREERIDFILRSAPNVSPEEMQDIENLYGKKPPETIDIAKTEILDL